VSTLILLASTMHRSKNPTSPTLPIPRVSHGKGRFFLATQKPVCRACDTLSWLYEAAAWCSTVLNAHTTNSCYDSKMTNRMTTFSGRDSPHEEHVKVSDNNHPRYCRREEDVKVSGEISPRDCHEPTATMSLHSPVLGARRKETEIPSEKWIDSNAVLCREESESSSHTKATASDSKDYTESSFDSSTSSPLHQADWEIPRWKALEAKRLALCRKRVQLERRLFESTLSNPCVSSPLRHDDSIPSSGTTLPRTSLESCTFATPSGPIVEWSGMVDERTGLPTGHGKMVFVDGQIYEGYCRSGLRHGIGRNAWPSSSTTPQVYTGEWVQGHREGRGTHCWPDGRTVTGNWKKVSESEAD
jgi:MORN repeat